MNMRMQAVDFPNAFLAGQEARLEHPDSIHRCHLGGRTAEVSKAPERATIRLFPDMLLRTTEPNRRPDQAHHDLAA